MAPAPGCDSEAWLVLSHSGKRLHLVLLCKAIRNLKSLGIIIPHSSGCLLKGQLSEFVNRIKKAKELNLMKFAVHGMPEESGKKGSCPPQKHSKAESAHERVEQFPTAQAACGNQSIISITIDSGTQKNPIIQQECSSTIVSSTASHSVFSSLGPYYPKSPLCQLRICTLPFLSTFLYASFSASGFSS